MELEEDNKIVTSMHQEASKLNEETDPMAGHEWG